MSEKYSGDRCLQDDQTDDDHTDNHDIKLFAEQLTRTFEVLVKYLNAIPNTGLRSE